MIERVGTIGLIDQHIAVRLQDIGDFFLLRIVRIEDYVLDQCRGTRMADRNTRGITNVLGQLVFTRVALHQEDLLEAFLDQLPYQIIHNGKGLTAGSLDGHSGPRICLRMTFCKLIVSAKKSLGVCVFSIIALCSRKRCIHLFLKDFCTRLFFAHNLFNTGVLFVCELGFKGS